MVIQKDQEILEEKLPFGAKSKKEVLKKRARFLKIKEEIEGISEEVIVGLEFILANERYAIESSCISEVFHLHELTKLPCTPEFIIGIINVRGRIISVIDLKKIFHLPENSITNLNRVILVKHDDIELGILVDEVIGDVNIYLDRMQSTIPTLKGIENDFLVGFTDDRLILINVEKILTDNIIIINEEV